MRVVCDNCGSVYKIPDDKLVKPVNKATCRSCGYRMLIPRPTGNEEERTLVTNNPMTPAGAIPRAGGPHTTPIGDDEPEHTMPVKLKSRAATPRPSPGRRVAGVPSAHSISYDDYPEVPLLPGTPMPSERKAGPPRPRGPHAPTPPEEKTSWVRNPTGGLARPPEPLPRDSEQPTRINARLTPEPAPAREPEPPPRPAPAAIDPSSNREPAPAPRAAPAPEPNYPPVGPRPTSPGLMYDPSADLNLALLGLFAALFGLVIFAVDFRFDNWMLQTLIRSIALLMSFGGVFTSLFVILTSSRGRRPASQLMSLLVSGVLAALALGFSLGVEAIRGYSPGATPPPVAAAPPASASLPDLTAPAEEPAVADASAPPTREPARPAAPRREPSAPASGPISRVSSPPAPSYEPPPPTRIAVPAAPPPSYEPPPPRPTSPPPAPPPSAPASGAMDAVPMEVIDVMLRNNIDVKKCFFAHLQKAGALPPRVDVRFTLENSGKVSALDVKQPDLQGSDLERCLGGAIRQIQFPPTTGAAAKITFPFIF